VTFKFSDANKEKAKKDDAVLSGIAPHQTVAGVPIKVLLVEDNKINMLLAKTLITPNTTQRHDNRSRRRTRSRNYIWPKQNRCYLYGCANAGDEWLRGHTKNT
jgi:hypothetical protein